METRQLAKLGKRSQTSGVFVKRVAVHFSLPGKFAGQEAPGTVLQCFNAVMVLCYWIYTGQEAPGTLLKGTVSRDVFDL
jgi:hypothetical protein